MGARQALFRKLKELLSKSGIETRSVDLQTATVINSVRVPEKLF